MADKVVAPSRILSPARARELRAQLPEVQCRIDDVLEAHGEGRKFPPCTG
jgi:hypothetical protein